MDVPSPYAGIIKELKVKVGDKGIARIGDFGDGKQRQAVSPQKINRQRNG